MNKKLLAAAVAAAFAAPMAASADAVIYGALHTAVSVNDTEIEADPGVGNGAGVATEDNITVDGRDGQLGIQGSEDLGNGLKAIYKMEFNLDTDDGDFKTKMDEVWVGLTGGWGTAIIGREDHPYKTFMDKAGVDILGDSVIDVDTQLRRVGANGFERNTADNVIAYVSPNFSGFSFSGAIVAAEQDGQTDDTDNDGFDAYSLGAAFQGGGFTVTAGYEDLDVDSSVEAEENWAVGASYTFGSIKIAGKYEESDNLSGVDDLNAERWAVSAIYKFGNNEIGATYLEEEWNDAADADGDGFGVMAAHNLSNRTKVYAAYADSSLDVGDSDETEDDVFSAGIIHSF